jgi:HEAT repeat protein
MARAVITSRGAAKADIMFGLRSDDTEETLNALDRVIEQGPGATFALGYDGKVADLLSSENEDAVYDAEASGQIDEVVKLLNDNSESVRASACIALGSMQAVTSATTISRCLSDKWPNVVSAAITSLAMLGSEGEAFESEVAKKLTDASQDVKSAALTYFAKFDDSALKRSESICKLLMDEDGLVRESAVKVFAALGEKAAPMADAAASGLKTSDIRYKAASAMALGNIGKEAKRHAASLAPLLQDTSEDTSQLIHKVAGIEMKCPPTLRIPACAAACALAKIDGDGYSSKIASLLSSNSLEVKMSAAAALGDAGSNNYEDALCELLDDNAPLLRATAATALGKIAKATAPEEKVAEKIAARTVDGNPLVKAACAGALGMMGEEGAAFSDRLHSLFQDQSKAVRASAAQAIGNIGLKGQLYAAHVARMLEDPEPVVRAAAVTALPALGQRGAAFADECAELLYDQDESVRTSAVEALAKMGQAGELCLQNAGVTPLALQSYA